MNAQAKNIAVMVVVAGALLGGLYYKKNLANKSEELPVAQAPALPAPEASQPQQQDAGPQLPGFQQADSSVQPEVLTQTPAVEPSAEFAQEPTQEAPASDSDSVNPRNQLTEYVKIGHEVRMAAREKELAESKLAALEAQKKQIELEQEIASLQNKPRNEAQARESQAKIDALKAQVEALKNPGANENALIPADTKLMLVVESKSGAVATVSYGGSKMADLKVGSKFGAAVVEALTIDSITFGDGKRKTTIAL